MLHSIARVGTEMPKRYLSQLCKHFEHKLPVTLAESTGHIAYPSGTCALSIEPDTLVMQVEAANAEALATLQDVVARHLLRFAFRQPPEIVWSEAV